MALLLLVATAVGIVLGAGRAADAPASAAAPQRSSGILTLDAGDIVATPEAWRGSYVVLQPWEYARIPALRERNPGITILMYKDVTATRKDTHESGLRSTGISFQEADARGWLLTDVTGRPIEWSDWSGLYPANIGDPGYQRQWGTNVLAELRAHGWDGVMMDDTLTYLSHSTVGDRVATQIPDDEAMYDATESFLRRVSGRVQRAGYLAVPNLTVEWDTWRTVLEDWTPYVSGWENEYFVKWGLDRSGPRFVGPDWQWKMEMAAWCADRDVPLLAVTYSNRHDRAAQLYHRATWLLTWNGRTGASVFVPYEDEVDHWTRAATAEIGLPTQARRLVGDTGVWRRDYTGGTVLVNPTTRARQVDLGEGYRRLGGREVSAVWVAPQSGLVLRHR
jgi:hypothetical protein